MTKEELLKPSLTPLLHTNLYYRILPQYLNDANDFHLTNVSWDKSARISCSYKNKYGNSRFMGYEVLTGINANDYTLLGTVTKEEVSFDCNEYVKCEVFDQTIGYYDYSEKVYKPKWMGKNMEFDKNASLRSLLASAGIYFDNPPRHLLLLIKK